MNRVPKKILLKMMWNAGTAGGSIGSRISEVRRDLSNSMTRMGDGNGAEEDQESCGRTSQMFGDAPPGYKPYDPQV